MEYRRREALRVGDKMDIVRLLTVVSFEETRVRFAAPERKSWSHVRRVNQPLDTHGLRISSHRRFIPLSLYRCVLLTAQRIFACERMQ